eukprot:1082716-Rhodomonas_salina.2
MTSLLDRKETETESAPEPEPRRERKTEKDKRQSEEEMASIPSAGMRFLDAHADVLARAWLCGGEAAPRQQQRPPPGQPVWEGARNLAGHVEIGAINNVLWYSKVLRRLWK